MSLFKRVIGLDETYQKIPIHQIQAFVSEITAGRISIDDAVTVMGLTPIEESEFFTFLTKLSLVPDKIATSSRVFNYLLLGEIKVNQGRDYTDEDLFWAMLEQEVV